MNLTNRLLSIFLVSVSLYLMGWVVAAQKSNPARITWEYKWVLLEKGKDPAVNTLNANGVEGWELVSTHIPDGDNRYFVFVFKRPK